VIITNFEWAGEANAATTMTFQGTGRNLAASASTVAFADQAGGILSWDRAYDATPGGLFMDTASPPTTEWKIRNFRFTLAQPHTFETGLGSLAGAALFTPFRTSSATAVLAWETFYEDITTNKDPAQNMADYIANTAQGVIINYRISGTEYISLNCHGTVDPNYINNPKIGWSPNGAVRFGAELLILPDVISDLSMTMGTTSGT